MNPRNRGLIGPVIKSVIFIVVTAAATTALGISIANTSVGAAHGYKAIFTDVTGLNVGDEVDIAGVRVGQVTGLSVVDRNLAQVSFSVQADRALPASVTATIRYKNLIGQRYVQLGQGAGSPGQVLPPGGTIPLSQTTPALSLTELFNGFQPLLAALSPNDVNSLASELIEVLQGEGGTMVTLLSSVGKLTTALAAKDKLIGQVIDNLNAVLTTVSSRGNELGDMVTTLQELVSGLSADRKPIGAAISAMASLTSATAGLLQAGRPALRSDIVALSRLAGNLAASQSLLARFLQKTPVKMTEIARLASYGSWLNLYLCGVTVRGVGEAFGPAPAGIPVTAARCS
jgi:phospholipid/cholesterol/gamma-HCH transport system substrate-binding protein